MSTKYRKSGDPTTGWVTVDSVQYAVKDGKTLNFKS